MTWFNDCQLMIVISDACTINIVDELYNGSKIIIDDSRATLQIVTSLTDDSRGVICDCNIFIIQATDASCYDCQLTIVLSGAWHL